MQLLTPATPLLNYKTLSAEGVSDTDSSNILSGYAIIKADNFDAALEIAKRDPFLEMGSVEIAEVMQM